MNRRWDHNSMSLDNESFVTLLYHTLLGRAPDEAGLASHLVNLNDGKITHDELVLVFLSSEESSRRQAQLIHSHSQSAEIRDTDKDWQAIAEEAPYHGVLVEERFRDPNSEDLAQFFASGQAYAEQTLATIRRAFGNFTPKSALDFGCGVGRLLIPLARIAGQAIGVDVAQGMLERAQHHIKSSRVNASVRNDIPSEDRFDWVNSFIVLQHIPPVRGYVIIDKLWKAVNVGGVMTLHVTTYHDHTHVGELLRELSSYGYDGQQAVIYTSPAASEHPHMTMYDYDLSRVLALLDLREGHELLLQHTQHGGCHGVVLYVRKS
jgi:2-polyprenyl-3-methyl-5-hydroxy-6-metoxy-1,4-benzoquinol methylase